MTMNNRAAVAVVNESGYMVGFADRNVRGYTPTTYVYETYDEAKASARNINEKLGVSAEEAIDIQLSSMRS